MLKNIFSCFSSPFGVEICQPKLRKLSCLSLCIRDSTSAVLKAVAFLEGSGFLNNRPGRVMYLHVTKRTGMIFPQRELGGLVSKGGTCPEVRCQVFKKRAKMIKLWWLAEPKKKNVNRGTRFIYINQTKRLLLDVALLCILSPYWWGKKRTLIHISAANSFIPAWR